LIILEAKDRKYQSQFKPRAEPCTGQAKGGICSGKFTTSKEGGRKMKSPAKTHTHLITWQAMGRKARGGENDVK